MYPSTTFCFLPPSHNEIRRKHFCNKMSEEGKDSHHFHHHHREEEQQPPQYGTFQGVANYPQPVIGFPQPVPPPGTSGPPPPHYYTHGYQAVPVAGYAVTEGTPVRQRRLPCCGCGIGWFLFIIGFLLAAIPWYVAVFIFLCAKIDPREKPGYIACTIAAILATIALVLGLTEVDW